MKKYSYTSVKSFSTIKFYGQDYFKKNKLVIFLMIFLILLSILTGIFTAIKNIDTYSLVSFNDYSIVKYLQGSLGTFELFFNRFASYSISIVIISVSSLTIFLCPITIGLIIYRGFLVAFNCTLIIVLFGLSGIITTILIIFPCQLIILFAMSLYALIASNRNARKRNMVVMKMAR